MTKQGIDNMWRLDTDDDVLGIADALRDAARAQVRRWEALEQECEAALVQWEINHAEWGCAND